MRRRRKTHLGDRDIPIIKIRTSDQKVETIDVAADLYVTDNMDFEFDRNPSMFSWYGTMAEDANTHAKKLKLRLDEKSSVLKTKYRNRTQGSGSRHQPFSFFDLRVVLRAFSSSVFNDISPSARR